MKPPPDRNSTGNTAAISYSACAICSISPPHAAAPVPAVAPAPTRSYLVFFEWDKATLTDRARQIDNEADDSTYVQRIEVNAYTDTSRVRQHNRGLSVRHASSGSRTREG